MISKGKTMTELHFGWITGLMFGLEFNAIDEIDDDLQFAMTVDLFIARFILMIWKTGE